MLLLQATASGRHRKQLGNGNFTDECYQMALFKRSHLIITFPSIGDQRREPLQIGHKNLITGYMLLKLVTGMKPVYRLTRLVSVFVNVTEIILLCTYF